MNLLTKDPLHHQVHPPFPHHRQFNIISHLEWMMLPGDIFPRPLVSTLNPDHVRISNSETIGSMNSVVVVVVGVGVAIFDPVGNRPEYKVDGKMKNQMIDYQIIINIIGVTGETVVDLTNVVILPRGDNSLLPVVPQEAVVLPVVVAKVHLGVEVVHIEEAPHLDLVGVVVAIFDRAAVVVKVVAAVSHVVAVVVAVDHVVGDQNKLFKII